MDETQLFHLKLVMRCYSSVHVQSAACRISVCWIVLHQAGCDSYVGTLALASVTAWEFYKVDAFAGKILLPYLAWLTFANALNYSIWKKNPGVCY